MADAAQVGAGQRALAVVAQARGRYSAMPAERRKWLLAGATLLLAVASALFWYSSRTDWRVLFSGLDGKDVQTISQELAAAGIVFEMTPDGTGIQVPAESVDKARMEVAAKGMPQSGRLGFELFDKPNWVGSEFDERVNYQRALEGELEHTIATLGVVRSARVHLVLPQASLFTSQEKVAKASVVLKLKRASLESEQTESIRNLVAGAVENLSPEQVTLVDADGRVNLQAHRHAANAGNEERDVEARLISMLEPLAGPGNVRAIVNVSYEQGSEDRTDEVYDPAQTATLTSQKSQQTSAASRSAQGVPGTASNTPAAAAQGAVQGSAKAAAPGTPPLLEGGALPVYPQNNTPGQSSTEESGTYAVTRHLVHTELGPGRVRRLSAAVVVNDRMVIEGAGKTLKSVWKPRTTEEMHRMETLAQAAVGFDEKRGDQVVMENVSFNANVSEMPAAGVEKLMDEARGLMHAQPGMLRTSLTALIGLLVVLLVLRPVATQVVAALREPMLRTSASEPGVDSTGLETSGVRGAMESGAMRPEWSAAARAAMDVGADNIDPGPEIFERVSDHIKREPGHSTRLIEAWIASDGEED